MRRQYWHEWVNGEQRTQAGASLDAANKAGLTPSELALSLGNQGLSRYLDKCRTIPIRARDVPLQRVSEEGLLR